MLENKSSSQERILEGDKGRKFISRVHSEDEQKRATEISEKLKKQFEIYRTSNIQSISVEAFLAHIQSKIGKIDFKSEGYTNENFTSQRDLSVKFHWGHNHDFGSFKIKGRMGDRHINLLANFIAFFPVSLQDFKEKNVFDIGCWTGGTTLLLAAVSSKVFAIEEVKKYAETASFLSQAFGLDNRVTIRHMSIYQCNSKAFFDRFDIAYFPGVIYHLTDPVLSLRIIFNSLSLGGIILVESAGINTSEPFCRFDGSLVHHSGSSENLSRGGWNWFIPSPSAMGRMMIEAGFDEVETIWCEATKRLYGFGKKLSQVGICKAGLSVPDIR